MLGVSSTYTKKWNRYIMRNYINIGYGTVRNILMIHPTFNSLRYFIIIHRP